MTPAPSPGHPYSDKHAPSRPTTTGQPPRRTDGPTPRNNPPLQKIRRRSDPHRGVATRRPRSHGRRQPPASQAAGLIDPPEPRGGGRRGPEAQLPPQGQRPARGRTTPGGGNDDAEGDRQQP